MFNFRQGKMYVTTSGQLKTVGGDFRLNGPLTPKIQNKHILNRYGKVDKQAVS